MNRCLVRHIALAAAIAAVSGLLLAARAQTAPAANGPGLDWPVNYDAAVESARQANQPLLVIFGASWCEACHVLDAQLKEPEAQKELAKVGRVYVDFDANHDLARKLGVGPIPALRVIRPTGRVVAMHDGAMPAQELAAWLAAASKAAAADTFDPALDADELSDEAIGKLVGMFGSPEASTREAAIRRLLPHGDKAAAPVVQAFVKGTLAQRLTALDILESWHAPVQDLDPWRPDTLTPSRLETLQKWTPTPAAQSAPALDERQRAEAKDLLQRYQQAGDEEAAAFRERLARFGGALLPDVYAALKNAPDDKTRERLTFLRYRLAASDVLAMQWPQGLERLASTQVKTRRSALDDLSNRAQARDSGLLLELFSDSDPLVRETALRLLQKVGGASATDALTGLLADPDPNVRAAVLKAVAEEPTAQIVQKVADYVAREQDTDLIVHAARVLRNSKSPVATKTLYGLLNHANWRVRAEAAEALVEKVGYRSGATPDQQAEFFLRMLDLLDDPDGFVASRALSALEYAQGLPSVEKIAKTADKHPELAAMAIKVIANNLKSDPGGLAYIKAYAAHKDPSVRASTITHLADALGDKSADYLHQALADSDERVRAAACAAILEQLNALLPEESFSTPSRAVPLATFLTNFHSGKSRPKWLADFQPELEKLLDSASDAEAVHAAVPLVALGFNDKALPKLKALVGKQDAFVDEAAVTLIWLLWDDRLPMYNVLKAHARPGSYPRLATGLSAGNEARAADTLWALLADPAANWSMADSINDDLRRVLLGSDYVGEMSAGRRREVMQALSPHVTAGSDVQRTIAVAMMSNIDPLATTDAAVKLMADPKSSAQLKHDMMQIQLNMLSAADAEQQAATLLADPAQRDLALLVLTGNSRELRYLHDSIYLESDSTLGEVTSSGVPIMPTAPKGLTADAVRPLLADKDPRVAAEGGYLLALLKDRSGMDNLIDFYHKNAADQDELCRLVYRAITALDDDSYTPVLADIYKTLSKSGSYRLHEFYWTIRSMTGEKCMDLRKRIRDEVGMDALR